MSAIGMVRKGERTRQKLMEAARLVFARDGYLNAEVSEISRVAEKSAGALYIYFQNKSAILDALIDEFTADVLGQDFDRSPAFYERFAYADLRETLRVVWDVYKRHAATFYALAQAAMIDRHFEERYRETRSRANQDFRGMIESRQAKGFCRGLDPHYGAECLETLLVNSHHEWLAIQASRFDDPAQESRAFETLLETFRLILGFEPEAHAGG